MDKIKVACFGLQGFGNDLLEALQNNPKVIVSALYTRKSPYKFSYYECDPLEIVAEKMDVPVFYVPDKGDWSCEAGAADLAIVSSFHRIFRKKHLDSFRHTINIHPALLPGYKGATPTNWIIKNGEQIAGLSAHLVDEGIDTGGVLFRRRLLNPYLNDNDLRKALAFFSREIVDDIIETYPNYSTISDDGLTDSFQPGRTGADAILKVEDIKSIEQLIFHIKAFTNFPMPRLQIGEKVFVVDYENPSEIFEITAGGQSFSIIGHWE
jgi:methionyl-tRNA formyltransferase